MLSVKQYDIKNHKTFLKRCRYEAITADMLYIGAVVTVYSRQLKLIDYADEFTRKRLSNMQERYDYKPQAQTHVRHVNS